MDGFDAIDRDIAVLLDDLQSPEARSARLGEFAAEQIADVRSGNKAVTGSDVVPVVIVDGRKGAPLADVKPNGVIVAEFDPLHDMLEWIGAELVRASPVLTGKYARSHVLEVDGKEIELPGPIPDGAKYVFVNRQPYARKIEPKRKVRRHRERRGRGKVDYVEETRVGRGQSPFAPDGVYQAVFAVASKRFGNIAKMQFRWDYYDYETGVSHPAIIVTRY